MDPKNLFRGIYIQRASLAALVCTIVQIVCVCAVITVGSFDVRNPVSGLWAIQNKIVSVYTFAHVLILAPFIAGLTLVHSGLFMVKPRFPETRFRYVCSAFFPRNLLVAGLYAVISVVFTFVYSTAIPSSTSIIVQCKDKRQELCLIEENVLYFITGAYLGLYLYYTEYFRGKHLEFPVVQQSKFIQLKMQIFPKFKHAAVFATKQTLFIFIVYYCIRKSFPNALSYLLGLSLESEVELWKFELVFNVWLLSTAFIFTGNIINLFVSVILTEHIKFPVSLPVNKVNCLTLCSVLTLNEIPLAEHLAYLDLRFLAEKDAARRAELFKLSNPGGHPHDWNFIVNCSLMLVKDFRSSLIAACKQDKVIPTMPGIVPPPEQLPNFGRPVLEQVDIRYNLRNMSISNGVPNYVSSAPRTLPAIPISAYAKEILFKALNLLHKIPGANYIFYKHQDEQIGYIILQSQPVIWAIESLSMLISASYSEDKFGIVEKDLPRVLTEFLSLKHAINKVPKFPAYKKLTLKDQKQLSMRKSLAYSIQHSLFRVCNTFGPYLKEFPLSTDVMKELETYCIHQES